MPWHGRSKTRSENNPSTPEDRKPSFSPRFFAFAWLGLALWRRHLQDTSACPLSGLLDMEQRQASAGRLNAAVLQSQQQEKGPWLPDLLRQLAYSQVCEERAAGTSLLTHACARYRLYVGTLTLHRQRLVVSVMRPRCPRREWLVFGTPRRAIRSTYTHVLNTITIPCRRCCCGVTILPCLVNVVDVSKCPEAAALLPVSQ